MAKNILILGENRTELVLFQQFFEEQGDHVEVASSADGLGRARTGRFDVVMIDDSLGSRTGIEQPTGFQALIRLHEAKPLLPVIVITASPRGYLRELGVYACVTKPPSKRWAEVVHTAVASTALYARLPWAKQIGRVAGTSLNVLIQGEPYTSTWLAKQIHRHSPRKSHPCGLIDCAKPEAIVEEQLFGRPARSASDHRRIGELEECENGTIILREVGQLSPRLQYRLRSMVEDATVRQTGWKERTNVRFIATTRRQLGARTFRSDLYLRINQTPPISIPAL